MGLGIDNPGRRYDSHRLFGRRPSRWLAGLSTSLTGANFNEDARQFRKGRQAAVRLTVEESDEK
jgi:hypothetical protein